MEFREKVQSKKVKKEGDMMNKISDYGNYQKDLYQKSLQKKDKEKEVKISKKDKTEGTQNVNQPELSDKAKALLEELKQKYSNIDFFVADYSCDEEAASYLNRGAKEYSVFMDPETLEQMAADDSVKQKYLDIIDDATGQLKDMKEKLGEEGEEVTRLGVVVDKDGTVSYFAELEKMSEKQRERIEKAKEEKKEEAIYSKTKRTTVKADSVEELMEKIKNVDWDKISQEEVPNRGGRFDFSV